MDIKDTGLDLAPGSAIAAMAVAKTGKYPLTYLALIKYYLSESLRVIYSNDHERQRERNRQQSEYYAR